MKESIIIRGRMLSPGKAEGEAAIAPTRLSFWGGYDARSGRIIEKGNAFEGVSLKGKVAVFLSTKGSSGTSNSLNLAKHYDNLPAAFINTDVECLAVLGCQLNGVPMMTDLEQDPFAVIHNGDHIIVNADEGYVEVIPKS